MNEQNGVKLLVMLLVLLLCFTTGSQVKPQREFVWTRLCSLIPRCSSYWTVDGDGWRRPELWVLAVPLVLLRISPALLLFCDLFQNHGEPEMNGEGGSVLCPNYSYRAATTYELHFSWPLSSISIVLFRLLLERGHAVV